MNRKSLPSLSLVSFIAWLLAANALLAGTSALGAPSHSKDVKTTVTIRTATQIGSTTLSPGKYAVKVTAASKGMRDSIVQFSVVENTYGDELDPYEEEVVLTVQASVTNLAAPATSTEVILSASDHKAIALKIRGKSTEYVFDAKTASAASNQ
jgi:hypothetical protein